MKVFDVNLRQSYYSQEILAESMKLADIVKLNDEELPKIMSLNNFPHKDELSSAQHLMSTYDLKLVCITRGGRGSLLARHDECERASGLSRPGGRYGGLRRRLHRRTACTNICKALLWV